MKTKTKLTALVTTILLLVGFAGPSQAAPEKHEPLVVTRTVEVPVSAPTVSLSYEKVAISTTPAPVAPPVVLQSSPVAPVRAQQTQTAATTLATTVRASTASTAPVQAASTGGNAALLASARSQIGQIQDCTAMVERALGSIGIVTGDLGPNQFFRFGSVVSVPAPGDIIISSGHVGIYAGNGMMVSGGFNGNQTVEHPISYVGGYSAVRVA